jgi:hypothetical protein
MESKTKEKPKMSLERAMEGATSVADVRSKKKEEEDRKREKEFQKRAAMELASYKKRLKEGVELKRLQVEELELNIKYYEAKKAWLDLQPKVDELDAREQALAQKAHEDMEKARAKKKKEGDLLTVKHGKPRDK